MKYLSSGNTKLKKDGIVTFSLPAGKTCPRAAECKAICYAMKGCFRFRCSVEKRARNFTLSKSIGFARKLDADIKSTRAKYIRIHDSGDFYSRDYWNSWRILALNNPDKVFYCYTKSHDLMPSILPKNFIVIKSVGGLDDKLIDFTRDVHARVFLTAAALQGAGYFDGSASDLDVIKYILAGGKRIGLVKH